MRHASILARASSIDVALVAGADVKGLNEGVFYVFPRSDEIPLHDARKRPVLERTRHEFGPVVDDNRAGRRATSQRASERDADAVP